MSYKNNNISFFVQALCSIWIFIFTYYVGSLFVYGDQVHYRYLYEMMDINSLSDSFLVYKSRIQSIEIIHFIYIYISSSLLPKDIAMSLANAFLAWIYVGVFCRLGGNVFLAALLVSTNSYFFSLYFSAERLKFGFIFFGLSILLVLRQRNIAGVILYSSIAVLAHAQILLLYISLVLAKYTSNIRGMFIVKKRNIPISLVILSFLLLVVYYLYPQLSVKLQAYLDFSVLASIKMMIISCLCVLYSRKDDRAFVLIYCFILICITMVVGGERINIYGFFLLFALTFRRRSGVNVMYLILLLYFGYKGGVYVNNIFDYGVNVRLGNNGEVF